MTNGITLKKEKAPMNHNAEHVSSSSLLKGNRCIVKSSYLHATSHVARGVPERGNTDDIVREPYDDRGDGPASQNRHGGCCVPNNTYSVLYPEMGRSAKKGSRVVMRIATARE